jgi:predicted aspartyl protease
MRELYRAGFVIVLIALGTGVAAASARCRIERFPPLQITFENGHPTTPALINGRKARFVIDSGDFYNMIWPAAAKRYGLPLNGGSQSYDTMVEGVGGGVEVEQQTVVRTFTLLNVRLHDVYFTVAYSGGNAKIAGLLGENVLHLADDEFDFPRHVMRFVEAKGCKGGQVAYWAAGQPVSSVRLLAGHQRAIGGSKFVRHFGRLTGYVRVNGQRVRAVFDTGAQTTILSLSAARRAGITPTSPGVVPNGWVEGIGGTRVKTWIAPVNRVQIGSEKIEHTRILIGRIAADGSDHGMLIGSDFFRAHRVYVSDSQGRLYFTYTGGRVFAFARHRASTPGESAAPKASRKGDR